IYPAFLFPPAATLPGCRWKREFSAILSCFSLSPCRHATRLRPEKRIFCYSILLFSFPLPPRSPAAAEKENFLLFYLAFLFPHSATLPGCRWKREFSAILSCFSLSPLRRAPRLPLEKRIFFYSILLFSFQPSYSTSSMAVI
ncbi:MAG: hypothetical protein VZQ80_02030, partial [Lachnospiraceae bacterium]|nr:hypothetical protein [Lachnospiraceae bacterium]